MGASVTVVYITPRQMVIMAHCRGHHAPFLASPRWLTRHDFQEYLRTCATKAGWTMPVPKDMDKAYVAFQQQHPGPARKSRQRSKEHTASNDGDTKQEEPILSGESWAPPTFPTGGVQRAQATYPHHPAAAYSLGHPETQPPQSRCTTHQARRPRCITKVLPLLSSGPRRHMAPATPHLQPLPHAHHRQDCGPTGVALPLLPHRTTRPPSARRLERTPTAERTLTSELAADLESVAIEYNRCYPQYASPHEARMRPLQHKCATLRGDKEEKERRQTITYQSIHPETGCLSRLMYAHITQGRPDTGSCASPRRPRPSSPTE